MKFKRMVKSIAVIMFTAVLTLDSVSANASGLKLNTGNESEEVGSLGDLEKEVESIGGGSGDVASPMKDESPTHAYRPKETILKAATCTSAGKKQVSCANPGCTIHASRVETIPALGHNLVYVYTAPTTSSTGWEGHKCSRCSYRNGTTLPRLESKDEPTKPPTPDPGTGGGGGNQGGGGNDTEDPEN